MGSWLLLHFVSADQKLQLWRYQHKWDMFSILYADNSKPAETYTLYSLQKFNKSNEKIWNLEMFKLFAIFIQNTGDVGTGKLKE